MCNPALVYLLVVVSAFSAAKLQSMSNENVCSEADVINAEITDEIGEAIRSGTLRPIPPNCCSC
jgi:hypothetical protein